MRYAKWALIIAILIFSISAASLAQCPMQCPTPCSCQQPCQTCCCPCPAAVPASLGAGPAADLQCLQCPNFDPAFARKMYAQNSVIIAVTEFGMQRANDGNLRDISREINGYLNSANAKLQSWYGSMSCAQASPDCCRAQAIISELSSQCNCFDGVYARTLSELLKQSKAANCLGGERAVTPQMRQQAQFLNGKENDWAFRLDRWVSEH